MNRVVLKTKRLIIRRFDEGIERAIRQLARHSGITPSGGALELFRRGTSLPDRQGVGRNVDDTLDDLIGPSSV